MTRTLLRRLTRSLTRSLTTVLATALVAVVVAALAAPGPVSSSASTTSTAGAGRAVWETDVLATVGPPGYPAYTFVHRNGRVYAGTYEDPRGSTVPSRVREWSRDGTLLRSWRVPGQRLDEPHGVQVANQTRGGKLVLLETSTSSVLTLDLRTGRFRRVARLPGTTPNYASWGPRGVLFVTDYTAGTIWKIPRSGKPRPWFSSPRLEGAGFGTTGIAYRPGRRDLLITQQTSSSGESAPSDGFLYRLPVRPRGAPGELETLWTSAPGDLPDGFGIGRSGHVYVALTGSNQLVELTAGGREVDRFPEAPMTGENGSEVPFDQPCSATFLGTRVLVANQSVLAGNPDHQAILAVEVGERGRASYLPRGARVG